MLNLSAEKLSMARHDKPSALQPPTDHTTPAPQVVRVFDFLGPLLQVARMDMNIKNNTLREATPPGSPPLPISTLVEADKAAKKV
jgi:hypothetical protein